MIREEIPEGTGVVAAHRPPISRHAFLEIIPATTNCRVFGVHLNAVQRSVG
jgi:hypothetical protein